MVVDRTLYDILGVEPNATHENILKAIRKKSLEHHPDRGGRHEMMQQVNAAKAILSEPELREKYDRYGLDGVQQGINAGNGQFGGLSEGLFDLFDLLSRNATGRRKKSRGTDIKLVVKVSLEELYTGSRKVIEVDRRIVCINCSGTGHRDGIHRQCKKCEGKGIEIITNRDQTIQQTRRQCSLCNGDGSIIDSKNQCQRCYGQKYIQHKEMLDVHIPCGSQNREKIKFNSKGNEVLQGESGTLWIILEQESHPTFNRDGDNLIMTLQINLTEALCGFEYPITLLDDRTVLLNHPYGTIIRPNNYRCIKGYGMPNKRTNSHGDLIIHFDVKFPDDGFLLSNHKREQLEAILPPKAHNEVSNKKRCYEKVELMFCDQPRTNPQEHSSNDHEQSGSEDEDVNLHEHSQGFPCPTQ